MACPCCEGGGGECTGSLCDYVEPSDGDAYIAAPTVTDCRGSVLSDTFTFCNHGQAMAALPCKQILDVEDDNYNTCVCLVLNSQCYTQDVASGTDGGGNGCAVVRYSLTLHSSIFVFNETSCQWGLIKKNSDITDSFCEAYGCNQNRTLDGECNAICPEPRGCDTECNGPFAGCDCNPLP